MNKFILFLGLLLPMSLFSQEIKVMDLRTDLRLNPSPVDTRRPLLSWELQSSHRGIRQSDYRILVSEDTMSLEKNIGTYWDSKKQPGDVVYIVTSSLRLIDQLVEFIDQFIAITIKILTVLNSFNSG